MPSEDSKPVKQESEDDERSLSSMVLARRKNPTNAGTVTPKPRPKPAKVKKDDEDFDGAVKPKKGSSQVRSKAAAKLKKEEEDDEKPIARRSSASKPAKKESSVKKQKKTEVVKGKGSAGTQQNGTKKEKKVYSLPGQKRDPPEERDPLRIFYETLYKQIPNSEMAQVWMMESGLLPKDKAQKVLDMKLKKKNQKFASPMKKGTPTTKKSNGATDTKKKPSPSPVSTSAKGKTAPSKVTAKESNKKRKASSDSDNDSDDDFVVNVMSKRQRAS
ncbi:unnamed protein product [Linum tenue]|uniref:Uncharacterized protein n=1 Tax=Linum tenue TaxID=586396 RepID=A0AAV0LMB8_9ROSI|nr:unnamed protein product [Linum tenue]